MAYDDFMSFMFSPAEVWMNVEILYKVCFPTDIGSWGCTLSESAG